MPEAVPVDTLIEQNRIVYTSDGIFNEGDYTRMVQNRITKGVATGLGREATGIRVGRPGGRLPVGTEIRRNAVECLDVGISLAAVDSLITQNLVAKNREYGVTVSGPYNVIEANRIMDTVGENAVAGLIISSVGNLIIRNALDGNWPFDLIVENPAENDLVENRCKRSSPPHLCGR
ncbi:MAG: NosD domain-containing protein [Mycobacterium leprae]